MFIHILRVPTYNVIIIRRYIKNIFYTLIFQTNIFLKHYWNIIIIHSRIVLISKGINK